VRLFVSEEIVAEMSEVLNYPKLRKIYHAEGLRHEGQIEVMLKIAKFVKIGQNVKVVLEHPADDKFIDCAVEAKADFVVNGDKHLLKLGTHKKIQMVSANEFLQVLETRQK
jgi:putative PIN family toxin of toxin-antitoxin system